MKIPSVPLYFELWDLPKPIYAINKIVRQPFFGRPPDSLRFAVYYNPSMLWIYGNAKERQEGIAIHNRAWCKSIANLFHREAAVAMGFVK